MESIKTEVNGRIKYKNAAGFLHREDGPAEITEDGTKYWCINGQSHRADGPATEYPNGDWVWYQYGLIHRDDNLQAYNRFGSKWWVYENQYHRIGGPADIGNNRLAWWRHGKRHRLNAPALININLNKKSPNEYWEFGSFIK